MLVQKSKFDISKVAKIKGLEKFVTKTQFLKKILFFFVNSNLSKFFLFNIKEHKSKIK